MARDVEADVVIHDQSDRGLRSATDGLKRYDRELDRTKANTDKVSRGTDHLGKSMSSNARSIAKLNNELGIAQKELGFLAKSFADTNSAAERMDLAKVMRKQQAEIRHLTKNKGILEALEPKPQEIAGLGSRIMSGITSGIGSAGPLTTALAGAGVAAAPFIGSAIAGAVIGGAGLGGVAGGIAIALHDQRVDAALTGLKDRVQSRLENAAAPFVSTTIAGIGRIEKALDSIDFEQIFGDSSKFVEPLSDGIGRAVESIGDGLEDLVANAGPVIDALSDGFADIGNSVGNFFSRVSQESENSARAVRDLTSATADAVDRSADLVVVLNEVYGAYSKVNDEVENFTQGESILDLLNPLEPLKLAVDPLLQKLDETDKAVRRTGSGTFGAADGFQRMSESADGAANSLSTLPPSLEDIAEETRKLVDANRNLYGSQVNASEAIARANEVINQNGEALSLNTEKGRENRGALNDLAGSLSTYYNKLVEVDGLTPQTAAKGDKLRASFIRTAEAAGYSAKQAKDLANKILGIPSTHDTKIKAQHEQALDAAREVRRAVNNIPSSKTVVIQATYKGFNNQTSPSIGNAIRGGAFAAGFGNFAQGDTGTTGGAEKARQDTNVTLTSNLILDGQIIDTRVQKALLASQRANNWNNKRKRL